MARTTKPTRSHAPLVTVYITSHNYGQFIRESIESVLNQTMKDHELIIIDDGSTDNSRDIIAQYDGRPNIQVIYQRQKGLNITNNIALRLARGKYIMRLDADDYLDHNALLVLSNALQEDDDLGLVFPDYYLVDSDSNVLGIERRHRFDKDVTLLDQPAHGACTMIRRQLLANLGGYDESFSCQDGYELWIKFIAHYKVNNISLPLFYYRRHGANLTRNESRLLCTRASIKSKFVVSMDSTLSCVAVIPVRGTSLERGSIALEELGTQRVIDWTIRAALAAERVQHVIVTSSDSDIQSHVLTRYGDTSRVQFIDRPAELGRLNVSLHETLRFLLLQKVVDAEKSDILTTLSVDCPFIAPRSIDEAADTMAIFDADVVISVRLEAGILYQHDGSGLHPILNQHRFTKLEREALFRYAGGVWATRPSWLRVSSDAERTPRIGHVVVEEEAALGLTSEFNLNLARLLATRISPATPRPSHDSFLDHAGPRGEILDPLSQVDARR